MTIIVFIIENKCMICYDNYNHFSKKMNTGINFFIFEDIFLFFLKFLLYIDVYFQIQSKQILKTCNSCPISISGNKSLSIFVP